MLADPSPKVIASGERPWLTRIPALWFALVSLALAFVTSFKVEGQSSSVIVAENARTGVPQSTWQPDGSVPTIRGFTSEISVNKGESITFYVQTPDEENIPYDLVVYRLGYYQGNGAREIARFAGTSVEQPRCLITTTPSLDPATDARLFPRLIDCGNWIPSWTWSTPKDLVSGLFMAKVQRRDTRISCGIFFVVRDDGRASDILLQTSDTTWQAYNHGPAYQGGDIPPDREMDGHSVYDSLNPRAYKVSYHRPALWAATNAVAPHDQYIEDTAYSAVLRYGEEYPMVRFLESNGFDVAYTTGKDSDLRGELIRNHRLFITSGHDEYWSLRQMQNIGAARDAGVHLAFFSGNTAYWKIRWEDNHQTMVVFKELDGPKLDPLPGVSTGLFRDKAFGPPAYDGYTPENRVTGLLTSIGFHVDFHFEVPAADGKLRFWRDTSVAQLVEGQVASFEGDLLGYELDGDADNGFRPAGLFHLSTTDVTNQENISFEQGRSAVNHHLSLYRAASGALVFNAGSMRLQRALAGYYNLAPVAADSRLQQAVVNLFADMNVQPGSLQSGLKRATRSSDATAPTAVVISPVEGKAVKVLDTVVVTGSAVDVGGRVAAVEVSTDRGATWHPARGREAWSYAFTPRNAGVYGIYARAIDDSGNIGARSSLRLINAAVSTAGDFVVNGLFDEGFEEVRDGLVSGQLGQGWFQLSLSGRSMSLSQGGLVDGISLQRVDAGGSDGCIGQDLTLIPGREYVLTARVFVESGRAAVRIGPHEEESDLSVPIDSTGRWENVTLEYRPSQAACMVIICSEGGPATFKVDDVILTLESEEEEDGPPSISPIGSQTIDEDGIAGPIPFTLTDVDSPADDLVLTVTSSNTLLLPTSNIVFSGTGTNRTVTLKPVADRFGTAQVTITVSDDGEEADSTSFTVTVNAVNDPPIISTIRSQTVDEDGTLASIAFTVEDRDTPVESLTLSARTMNPSLVPLENITFAGSGAQRTVTIKPVPNLSGIGQVMVLVSDGGEETDYTLFTVTVNPVNDPPTLSSIGKQTVAADGTVGPIPFTIADIDTALSDLKLTATTSNSELVPLNNVVFGGSGSNRTVTIRPQANRSGTAQVTITLSDGVAGSVNPSFTVPVESIKSIAEENARPGVPQSIWQPGGSVASIRGFASEISVNRGQDLTFFVQTPDAPNVSYDLVVYRLGYYQGNGAREVARFAGVTVDQPQCLSTPTPSLDPATDAREFARLIDCGNWIPSWTWTVPANLMSGLFMAKLQRRDTLISSAVFFVVRDDTRKSDILLQTSDTTWQAYNYGPAYQGASIPPERSMDGHSLYDELNRRAYKVSTRRPHLSAVTNSLPPFEQSVIENSVGHVLGYGEEYSMIRFLEANGFDVAYSTGKDSDQRGELIRNHRIFMTSGQDEYWSARQRQYVEAARDAGVHLAFFSGNSGYWKIRWEDDYHTMVVFKERAGLKLDPMPGVTTGPFRDPSFSAPRYDGHRPENGLSGLLSSQSTQAAYPLQVPEPDGKLHFWRNTSVAQLLPGQVATFDQDLLGFETDGDVDNGFRPAGLMHLSTTVMFDQVSSSFELGVNSPTHHLSLYRAPSGAWVFHAGTMRLQRALAGYYNLAPARTDVRLQQAVVNLFADMGVQPGSLQSGLTLAKPSDDQVPPVAQVTAPRDGTCVKVLDTVVVSGSAADTGGRVAAVEVSVDGGVTWHPASGREAWSYAFTPRSAGIFAIAARAVDDNGNLGVPSAVHLVNAAVAGAVDFVVNGRFEGEFASVPGPEDPGVLGQGWFYRSASGQPLILSQGSLIPGLSLQRVSAGGDGDGIGQHVTLAPGRVYTLSARVLVEKGRAVMRIGPRNPANDVQASITQTGRWQNVTLAYSPSQADCTMMINSDGGSATFKVDEVTLTTPGDGTVPGLLLSLDNGGNVQLDLQGLPGFTCCVQTSTNLLDWEFLFLGNSSDGHLTYRDPLATSLPWRFYRAEAP